MTESLTRLNHRQPPNLRMKSIFKSKFVWGSIISMLSRLFQMKMTPGEGGDFYSLLVDAWPAFVGAFADLSAVWGRITATRFNLGALKSPTFWKITIGAVMSVLGALGVDWTGLAESPEKIAAAIASLGTIIGTITQYVGRATAAQPLGLVADPAASPRASIVVPSWLVVILRMIPWRILMAYVLEKWAGIAPGQFEEIIKTVLAAEPKALDGGEKSMLVHDSASRNWPELKPHEREAAVALAVAGLASEGKLKLS